MRHALAEELRESLSERLRAQASQVSIWQKRLDDERTSDYAFGSNAEDLTVELEESRRGLSRTVIVVHTLNTSDQPVYDLILR